MPKELSISKRLKQQFEQLSQIPIFEEKVSLSKSAPGRDYHSYRDGKFHIKKGVINDQVIIFPVQDKQLSIGFTINNPHDIEKAQILASCKIHNKYDPQGAAVHIYSDPMNYENFKNKLNLFITNLNENHGLKDSLKEAFSITIPEYKNLQNYVIDYIFNHGGNEGRLAFIDSYVQEKISTTKDKINNVNSVFTKNNKKHTSLVSVEDLETQIKETEEKLAFLKKQLALKNKEQSQQPETLEDLNKNLKKFKEIEDIIRGGMYASESEYKFKLETVQRKMGVSLEAIFSENQRDKLLTFVHDNNNIQLSRKKRI